MNLGLHVHVLSKGGNPRSVTSVCVGGAVLSRCLNTLSHCGVCTGPGVLMVTAGWNQAVLVADKSEVKWYWAFFQECACLFMLRSSGLWYKIRQWPRFPR